MRDSNYRLVVARDLPTSVAAVTIAEGRTRIAIVASDLSEASARCAVAIALCDADALTSGKYGLCKRDRLPHSLTGGA